MTLATTKNRLDQAHDFITCPAKEQILPRAYARLAYRTLVLSYLSYSRTLQPVKLPRIGRFLAFPSALWFRVEGSQQRAVCPDPSSRYFSPRLVNSECITHQKHHQLETTASAELSTRTPPLSPKTHIRMNPGACPKCGAAADGSKTCSGCGATCPN